MGCAYGLENTDFSAANVCWEAWKPTCMNWILFYRVQFSFSVFCFQKQNAMLDLFYLHKISTDDRYFWSIRCGALLQHPHLET